MNIKRAGSMIQSGKSVPGKTQFGLAETWETEYWSMKPSKYFWADLDFCMVICKFCFNHKNTNFAVFIIAIARALRSRSFLV